MFTCLQYKISTCRLQRNRVALQGHFAQTLLCHNTKMQGRLQLINYGFITVYPTLNPDSKHKLTATAMTALVAVHDVHPMSPKDL